LYQLLQTAYPDQTAKTVVQLIEPQDPDFLHKKLYKNFKFLPIVTARRSSLCRLLSILGEEFQLKQLMQPFTIQIEVHADDIDVLGHVNNVVYQHYLERIAIEHSNHLGFSLQRYRELGGVFVMRRIVIDYLRSAVLGDVLNVTTWLDGVRGTRATRHYEIRKADSLDLLLTAEALWVWIDQETLRPRPLPQPFLDAFQQLTASES
jgi:acyl-CoA thioester hydrolase